jgi:ABC-2 type transport system ATP-binding protein
MSANKNKPAIVVSNVSKDFHLPHEKINSIKSSIVGIFKKKNKNYEVQHALKDISFEIPEGEFFGIVGRNGSGKSTLLKIIAGIYQPNVGSVTVNGRLVPFIELGVGFNPDLSGRENVYLNGALLGFPKEAIDAKYNSIVDFAELERFMDQKLKNYSSGMQVRLAFSVATILAESDILLIDEVLAVGDADFQRKCFDYFKNLKKNKKTVIFVSHDMNAIREYCDRAVLIDNSKIIHSGTSDEIAKEYTRLFMPDLYKNEEVEKKKQENGGKWGYGGADIRRVTVAKKTFSDEDKYIDITIQVEALKDFEEGLVYGLAIKDQAGLAIAGTNSRIIRLEKKRKIAKGEIVNVEWQILNIFSEGTYTFEPALNNAMNMELCQWWDEAATFNVVNETSSPYPVSPDIKMKVTKK